MNDAVKIDIDKNSIENIDNIENDVDKPPHNNKPIDKYKKRHNNKPITKIGISPNGKYLVTYSEEDKSIVGWNIEDKDESPLKLDKSGEIDEICVSDDKELIHSCYIQYHGPYIKIYDMKNNCQEIKLDLVKYNQYFLFNSKSELILLLNYELINYDEIYIYSTHTKNKKWKCKRMYKILERFRTISISKYDKLYLLSNNHIYEWNLITKKNIKLLTIDEEIKYNNYDEYKKNISISSNEKFTCLKYKDKIIIFSVELETHIVSLDINNDNQLCMSLKNLIPLFPLLFPLFSNIPNSEFWDSIMKDKKEIYLSQSEKYNQSPKMLPDNIQVTDKYIFGILDGNIWKFDLEKMISNIKTYDDLNNGNSDNIIQYCYFDNNNQSHVIDTIHKLFKEVLLDTKEIKKLKLSHNLIKWKISIDEENIQLQVFKKINADIFSKYALPLPNYNSFLYYKKWRSEVKDNKELFLKYGVELLAFASKENLELMNKLFLCIKDDKELLLKYGTKFLTYAIKEHDLEKIDEIYKKCIIYFKEDIRNNNTIFLSIITSTILLLNKHYPEYITRYSLETSMIIDSLVYNIKSLNDNLHLHSLQYPRIINLFRSIWFQKYDQFSNYFYWEHKTMNIILAIIQILIILLFLPIYFVISYILYKYGFIHFTSEISNFAFLYFYIIDHVEIIYSERSKRTIPTITFMNCYIKFVNYPQNYNWFLELFKPQPSPFVQTITYDIYKTWDGESLINFKWNVYGKYYYIMIWIGYMTLFGCFTATATIPQQYISNDIQKQLLITSIILGFFHLNFEVHIIAFLLPIYTSIYWLQTDIRNIQLLSFTCLFLNLKFLLFFRVFESFGIYFAIIISVGKQIIYFLVVLLIIIISFAHALYILLSPKDNFSFEKYTNNNDPNNPWNIATIYRQVFENGTFDPNSYMIQQPDGNTNMFVNFRTALFAMYLFLTGDSSVLTNWPYLDNPALAIMIVLFSFLIVVYLMNLFIGLLNMAIEKDNNRVSYLIQKAEILAEIELFYLLPHQRRWSSWFPEVIHYHANVDKTREKIKEMMEKSDWNYWYTDEIREMKINLLKKLNIQPVDETSLQESLKKVQDKQEISEKSIRQLLEEKQEKSEKSIHQLLAEIHKLQSKS
ncbi:hypothetical protein GLOIN_2v1790296 [Rhizophagus clarus]|uniref:Ion transport domain-containing protein n=1 Tax=Rhizophagus clarus TaxID=94130 RepID=A0A8H3MGE2_9GLOM|nr:hypothetical protein GLOIN_2v1790296 [Rhizophagus clarus]